MGTHDPGYQTAPRRSAGTAMDEWVAFLAVPVLGTLDLVFDGAAWDKIALAFISGLLLGSVIGLRYTWTNRHPLPHEQSHVKWTILVSVVLWTACVVAAGVVVLAVGGWESEDIDAPLWAQFLFLLTVGQVFMVLLGAVWGVGTRDMDWYPLRRTRASVVRLIALYLLALVLVSVLSAVLLHAPRWQLYLGFTGEFLIWLGIARLWRG